MPALLPSTDAGTDTDQDDFGSDIALDDELQSILYRAESTILYSTGPLPEAPPFQSTKGEVTFSNSTLQNGNHDRTVDGDMEVVVEVDQVLDMEDVTMELSTIRLSPFEEFRRKGWLSVSDLVGTIWCEVQVRKARYHSITS
jgi:exonuclease V